MAAPAQGAAEDQPHPLLLQIRQCITAQDRNGVLKSLATADANKVPIDPNVRAMLMKWLANSMALAGPLSKAPVAGPPAGMSTLPAPLSKAPPAGLPTGMSLSKAPPAGPPAGMSLSKAPPAGSPAGMSPSPGSSSPSALTLPSPSAALPSSPQFQSPQPSGALPSALTPPSAPVGLPRVTPPSALVGAPGLPLAAGAKSMGLIPPASSTVARTESPAKLPGDRRPPDDSPAPKDSPTAPAEGPHPVLLKIRKGIAGHDRGLVEAALVEADAESVPIKPEVRSMVLQWLAGQPPKPAAAAATDKGAAPQLPVAQAAAGVAPAPSAAAPKLPAASPPVAPSPTPTPPVIAKEPKEEPVKMSPPARSWDGSSGVIASKPVRNKPASVAPDDMDKMFAELSDFAGSALFEETKAPKMEENHAAPLQSPEETKGTPEKDPEPAGPPPKKSKTERTSEAPPAPREEAPPPPPAEMEVSKREKPPPPSDEAPKRPAGRGRGRPLPASTGEKKPAGRGRGSASASAAAPPSPPSIPSSASARQPEEEKPKKEKPQFAEWEGHEEKKVEAPAREAWEYLKKDTWGTGNFFDFNAF